MGRSETHDDRSTDNAGALTDQHITGAEETGEFTTDKPPTPGTPADGSTNAGINKRAANRQTGDEDSDEG